MNTILQYLFFSKIASAQVNLNTPAFNPLQFTSFSAVANAIASMLAAIGIPLAVIFFIWSGFLFVTAQGNEQQLTKAKKAFFWTAIGTILLIGAYALAAAVANFAQTI
jgi:hypothetical protein